MRKNGRFELLTGEKKRKLSAIAEKKTTDENSGTLLFESLSVSPCSELASDVMLALFRNEAH